MSKSKNEKLFKGIGIYAVGTFGTRILSFLMVPLYTYYISTYDMGIYDILMATISLLTPIVTMQISDATYRWIIRDDVIDKEKYIRATFQVLLINCVIAIIAILCVNKLSNIPYVLYFCSLLFLTRAFETIQRILRGLKKQWMFSLSGILYTIIFLVGNIIQFCILKRGVESLFISAIIAYFIAIIVIILLESNVRVNIFKSIDINLIKEMYKFSIPLVPNYLNWWVINSSDKYIVLSFLGASANGVLAIAHKFPTILQTILGLFTSSWQDLSLSEIENNNGKYYSEIFKNFSKLAITSMFWIVPLTKMVILLIMGGEYKTSCNYVAFYYLGSVFQSFSSFYGVGYLKSTKTKNAFFTSIYGAVVNFVTNIILIRVIGLQAAAISTFLAFLIMWLIRERQNRQELEIKVDWVSVIFYTGLAIVISIISIKANLESNIIISVIGIVFFIACNFNYIIMIYNKLCKSSEK